ncbi:MAG: addiction module protein [Planctomycetia bacterium]|nr:addiction module protein [Planctomycetia bacterium]
MLRHHPPESESHKPSARQVYATGLRLKPRDRVSIARRLLASVERDPVADEDEAFDAMLLRRFEELRSGAVKGHTAEESLAMVRRGMRRKR